MLAQIDRSLLERLGDFVPSGVTFVVVVLLLFALRRAVGGPRAPETKSFRGQIIMLIATALGAMIIGLTLAEALELTEQALNIIGGIVVGTIGLSSTTILGNALAGVQLRLVGAFRTGDFLRVGQQFGRVTERGLFHTEIQTEDRDLTTLPNLFLVSNPYRVIRASGTITSATVSLGYDIPNSTIHTALMQAAEKTGLGEPFVQIQELGDFSVTYRIAGLLEDVKQVLTTRSNLHRHMLECLHAADVEIVSPTMMTTRAEDKARRFMPDDTTEAPLEESSAPEAIMFDKAEQAEFVEQIQARLTASEAEIVAAKAKRKTATTEAQPTIDREIAALERGRDALAQHLAILSTLPDPDANELD